MAMIRCGGAKPVSYATVAAADKSTTATSASITNVPSNAIGVIVDLGTGAGNMKHVFLKNLLTNTTEFVMAGDDVTTFVYDSSAHTINMTFSNMGGTSGYYIKAYYVLQ